MNIYLLFLSFQTICGDYLKFSSLTFDGVIVKGSVSIYTSLDLLNPITGTKIQLYAYPPLTTESIWELTTISGTSSFKLYFWCLGTFHLVASAKGFDSSYSQTYTRTSNNDCYPLTTTISKTSVLINEIFSISLYTQWSIGGNAISCYYKISDSKTETVYGETISELTSLETQFDIYMITPGVKNLIAECFDGEYSVYVTKSFQIYVSSSNDYSLVVGISGSMPKAIAETFTAIIEVYDNTGMKTVDTVMVYLAVIGGKQLFGYLLGETVNGDAIFENLSFMAYGYYQLIATSSNIFSEASSYIQITGTLTEIYLKIIVLDNLDLGESFSLTVEVYFTTNIYTSGSYNVNLDMSPSNENIQGSLTGTSSSGLITFTNLSINTEGLYAFFASADGIKSEFSQTFSVKTKDYIKITLSDTNLELGNLFTITLEVFVDSSLTLSESTEIIINLIIFQDTTIQISLSGSTNNGILIFTDLSLSTLGDFTISATSDTTYDASSTITIQNLCALLSFKDNLIVNSI
ncbi:hypothetical protein SteCoe_1277 [Stentor coeruleus]|uniref:Uncharacterized protein n=1 Tax=Stentor coeruleus TaxID=5963 RepID=A0A1R2D267_9CILI|nr:hypothetical protein SteCoe_1277 [Stentor coeruleus]